MHDYLYARSSITEYLQLKDYASDEEIVQELKRRYFYLNDAENISLEHHKERKEQAENLIRQLYQTKLKYIQVSMFYGNIYFLAKDLLKKQDYRNAKVALAIAYTHTLFNPGNCFVTTKEEYESQMNMLPLFVRKFYQRRNFSTPLPDRDYKEIKKQLLKLLEEK